MDGKKEKDCNAFALQSFFVNSAKHYVLVTEKYAKLSERKLAQIHTNGMGGIYTTCRIVQTNLQGRIGRNRFEKLHKVDRLLRQGIAYGRNA